MNSPSRSKFDIKRPWLNKLRAQVKPVSFQQEMKDPEFVAIYREILSKMLTANNPLPVKTILLGELNRVGGSRKKGKRR